ncbi:MAG: T9SS type A sorting domain-containing protein, partial [Bacteroidota bacterium]
GTTTESGYHSLLVITQTSGKIRGTPPFPDIPQVLTDTISDYHLFVNWPTGILEFGKADKIQIYPNPSNGIITVEGNMIKERGVLVVYDVIGKQVRSLQLTGEVKQDINLSDLPSGMYSCYFTLPSGIFTQKLFIR